MLPNDRREYFDEGKHQYFSGGRQLVSVTTLLRLGGFIDDSRFTEQSRLVGQAVHLAAHYFNKGILDWESLHPVFVRPRLVAYKKFIDDTGFRWRMSEQRLYDPVLGCAGTLDIEGACGDEDWLIDIKSGEIPAWAALQTAGYDCMLVPGKKPRKRFGLRLKPDGNYKLIPFPDDSDRSTFLAVLAVHHWKVQRGIISLAA